ncbi:hypothetical protein ACFLV7_04480 [Chloroflexota bacterium]
MVKITVLDRILLSLTILLAAYQIVFGVEGSNPLAVTSYTIAFGVMLVAALLLIILGFEVLDSPAVIIISTIIPLSLSLGLIADFFPKYATGAIFFTMAGFLAVLVSRYLASKKTGTIILIVVHGISGLLIFGLPIYLSFIGTTNKGFLLVGIGGGLFGIGGMLLSFLKTGRPILSREKILSILPVLMLLTIAAFVAGFALA